MVMAENENNSLNESSDSNFTSTSNILQTNQKYSNKVLFSIVFNIVKEPKPIIGVIPKVPKTPGKYIFIFNSATFPDVTALRKDEFCPYGKLPQMHKFNIYIQKEKNQLIVRRKFEDKNNDEKCNFVGGVYCINHEKYPITKKIYYAIEKNTDVPTKIVVFYEIKKKIISSMIQPKISSFLTTPESSSSHNNDNDNATSTAAADIVENQENKNNLINENEEIIVDGIKEAMENFEKIINEAVKNQIKNPLKNELIENQMKIIQNSTNIIISEIFSNYNNFNENNVFEAEETETIIDSNLSSLLDSTNNNTNIDDDDSSLNASGINLSVLSTINESSGYETSAIGNLNNTNNNSGIVKTRGTPFITPSLPSSSRKRKSSDILDSNQNTPSTKKYPRRCKNKIHVTHYFALNYKLENRLLVVQKPDEENLVYHYSTNTKGNKYFKCLGCFTMNVRNNATLYEEENEVWTDNLHACKPIEIIDHESEQLDRRTRLMVADGIITPMQAHILAHKEADSKGLKMKHYFQLNQQYCRWRGANIPNCEYGNIAKKFHFLNPVKDQPLVRWLLHENKKLTGFSTDLAMNAMASAEILMMDATYGTRPIGSYQYLTIHGLIGKGHKEWQPLYMAVMSSSNKDLYNEIIQEIKNYWNANSIVPTFERILTDYEEGLQNAAKYLSTPEKVGGCFFHYSQSILKTIMKMGLGGWYKLLKEKSKVPIARRSILIWLQSILTLPLLPIEERNFVWNKALKNPPKQPPSEKEEWPIEEMKKFVEYMEITWLTKTHNTLCFFNNGRVKNTNRCESWNSLLTKHYEQKPKYNIFIDYQQMIFSMTQKRVHELIVDGVEPRPLNPKSEEVTIQLKAYEDEYIQELEKVSNNNDYERMVVNYQHLRKASSLFQDVRNKTFNTPTSTKNKKVKTTGNKYSQIWKNNRDFEEDNLFPLIVKLDEKMDQENAYVISSQVVAVRANFGIANTKDENDEDEDDSIDDNEMEIL